MIIYTGLARDDLTAIATYTLENWGRAQRNAYIHGLDSAFEKIDLNPMLGIKRPEIQDNMYSQFHQKHAIFYTFDDDNTFILRVLHQSRDVLKAF